MYLQADYFVYDGNGRRLVLGKPGNAIIPGLAALPEETVITKPGKGALGEANGEGRGDRDESD